MRTLVLSGSLAAYKLGESQKRGWSLKESPHHIDTTGCRQRRIRQWPIIAVKDIHEQFCLFHLIFSNSIESSDFISGLWWSPVHSLISQLRSSWNFLTPKSRTSTPPKSLPDGQIQWTTTAPLHKSLRATRIGIRWLDSTPVLQLR